MKFSTLSRHAREAMKNIFRNGWMTVAAVAAVTTTLVLVAASLAIILNLNQIAKKVEQDIQIDVLIDNTADEADIKLLGEELEQMDGVKSVVFSSKEDELKQLKKSFGDNARSWEIFEKDNPLNHVYKVKTSNPEDTVAKAKTIEKMNYVEKVNYGEETVKRLFQFNKYARAIGIVLIVGLLFTAIFLISNTIKLTIMARSKEIGIMKLVGATNGFIRWPFFIEGMLLGLLGSVVPIILILSGYYYLDHYVKGKISYSFMDLLPYNPFAFELSIIVILLGVLIGVWGSVMSIRKFLKI
ncbi:permease-like cell division protein FtsX [Aciduricibacillus chroicocephali]|uniref:Cell division protein FtsX n=1 Tax=Aciduricibacillus chroicocephali TaxID=3054939 RepID=A0ABY9KSS5_9BACI|nr:permease-like cell division protein FtsX [Bacillaceae bacterium 44XB]